MVISEAGDEQSIKGKVLEISMRSAHARGATQYTCNHKLRITVSGISYTLTA